MNKGFLYPARPIRWALLIVAACFACYFAATAGMRARTIPAPPWAARGGEPTNAVEILNYLDAVMAYLPDSTIDELFAAQSSGATETELQSIIYRERVAAVRFEDQIIDYNNLGSLTNTLRWAHLAAMLRQVLRMIDLYQSQWELTAGDATNHWQSSLAELLHGLRLLDQLKRRVDDPGDPLDNLEQYAALLPLPGFSRVVYNWAYILQWRQDYHRAKNLFGYLINSGNPDGFCVGNSHYWLAVYHYALAPEPNRAVALDHVLKVHLYPSCLVFIDCAYNLAAAIYEKMGMLDTALALYSIHVPSISYDDLQVWKAQCSFAIALKLHDVTNAVAQQARAAFHGASPDVFNRMSISLAMGWGVGESERTSLMRFAKTPEQYEFESIVRALSSSDQAPSMPDVAEMLLHEWPQVGAVDPTILTNRLLSNNVFDHNRRDDIPY